MLLNRRTYKSKRNEADKVAACLKSILAQAPFERPVRIYTDCDIGQLDTVMVEVEYESLAQYEQIFPKWGTTIPDDLGNSGIN